MDITLQNATHPWLRWTVAGLAFAWNAYGIQPFIGSVGATTESLMASGLTAEQAIVMTSYPSWMTVAFAAGVFGGLIGSVLLLLGKRHAEPVFHVSLANYIALYFGDVIYGVFEAMGAQHFIILSAVVAIAAGLSWYSRKQNRLGQLT